MQQDKALCIDAGDVPMEMNQAEEELNEEGPGGVYIEPLSSRIVSAVDREGASIAGHVTSSINSI